MQAIIHMNGRIYDPYLGRFIQADPYIQSPNNTQSYNRYSYVWNNPLRYTDPSGHFVFTAVAAIATAAGYIEGAYAVAAAFAAAGAADTLAAGGSLDEALKNGIISGVSAGAFSALGSTSAFAGLGGYEEFVRVASFGAVGGITSVLSGGKFGHGFVSAGLGASVSYIPGLRAPTPSARFGRVVVGAVVGGTSSKITGGKFANGAAYGAFSALLNQVGRALRDFSIHSRVGGNVYSEELTTEEHYAEYLELKAKADALNTTQTNTQPSATIPTVSQRRTQLMEMATGPDREKFSKGLPSAYAEKIPGLTGKVVDLAVGSDIFHEMAAQPMGKFYDALMNAGPNGMGYINNAIDARIQYELENGMVRPD